MGLTMTVQRSNQSSFAKRTTLAVCAMTIAIALGGCSAENSQVESDSVGSASTTRMSPEQCAANANIEESAARDDSSQYHIHSGDQLGLDFYMNPEFNDTVTVDPNGKIVLRLVGAIRAAGLTPDELAVSVNKAYESELRSPGAVVHLRNMPNRQIYVAGEVAKPGGFPLQPGMTAVQAVALAGGVTDNSDLQQTVLIRRDACGQPQGSKIDLASAIDHPGTGNDVALMSHDVVVIPKSGIAKADLWVKQHIRDVLPVEPAMSPAF